MYIIIKKKGSILQRCITSLRDKEFCFVFVLNNAKTYPVKNKKMRMEKIKTAKTVSIAS